MSTAALSILVIEDDLDDRELVRRAIRRSGLDCELHEAAAFGSALDDHASRHFDFVLIDNGLPDGDGIDLIEKVQGVWKTAGVALVTGLGSEDLAAGAIKNGAVDYIPKRKINHDLLARVIENGVRVARLQSKIRSQTEALQNFAQVLAHDLRSPLHAVRILAESMVDGTAGGDEADIRQMAEMMMRYSDRLTRLIASLEQYHKLNHTPAFETVAADALLDNAIENLAVEIEAHDVHFERDPLPPVECSPPEIIRLFQNLVSNAIKYRSERPPVIRISCEPAPNSGRCLFHVADNGTGIPASDREKVFEEFRRLHNRGDIDGTGLGLSMCRRIVERHGGRIACGSSADGGAVFSFDLPSPAVACASVDRTDALGSRHSVL